MKRLTSILLAPLGLVIYLAMLAYLAWERRTSPWHRPRPMGGKLIRTANGVQAQPNPYRAVRQLERAMPRARL